MNRNMEWVFTDAIYQWERGENFGPKLEEIPEPRAEELIERFRERWGQET